ncbi:protein bicaudal C [Dermatophagoides pteronyssinus]|uniref:protein bicaudal C n=1 Tax=Dermatophagoides pteronyssinus TaxID=6956 RepID=UPI003F66E9BE
MMELRSNLLQQQLPLVSSISPSSSISTSMTAVGSKSNSTTIMADSTSAINISSNSSNNGHLESDSLFYEKDLKVDKKILAIMNQGGNDTHPSLNKFLSRISIETNCHVDVSNSLRDRQGNEIPVLKVRANNPKSLEVASALIMERLDPHRDKMTFNIDVPYNDHSYIIGKDGTRIKQLSRMTGCHIHLPDCNKTSNKKSNKLSIAGTEFTAIDKARDQIRKSLPLNIGFKAQIKSGKFVRIDTASAEVQAVKRKYRVDVTFTNVVSDTRCPEVTINVKGGRAQLEEIEAATRELYQFVTEEEFEPNHSPVMFAITIDISHSHHQYVKGKNNCNLKVINSRSHATILFPPHESNSNQVIIQSRHLLSTVMGWQELMGYLPLLLSFDVNFDINAHQSRLQRLEKEFGVGIRTREKLSGHVYTVLIKTQERHSTYLQEIRQRILNFKSDNENQINENKAVLALATIDHHQQQQRQELAASIANPMISNRGLMNLSSPYAFSSNVLQPMIDNNMKTIKSNRSNSNFQSINNNGFHDHSSNCPTCHTNCIPGFSGNDTSLKSLDESLPFCQPSSSTTSFNPFNFRESIELSPGKPITFGDKLNSFNPIGSISNGGNNSSIYSTTNVNGHQSTSAFGFNRSTIGTSSTNHKSSWPSLVTTNGIGNNINNNHIHQNNDHFYNHHHQNNNDYLYNQIQSSYLKCSAYDDTMSNMKSYSTVFK